MTSHAEICPVCQGSGKIVIDHTGTAINSKTCHGCAGLGWVTVPDWRPLEDAERCEDKKKEHKNNSDSDYTKDKGIYCWDLLPSGG